MAQWTETVLAAAGTLCLMAGTIGWIALLGGG